MSVAAPFTPPRAAATSSSRAPGRPSIVKLTWLLGRPSAQSAATLILPGVAFAVTTALILIVLGGVLMFWRWTIADAITYQALSLLALALLIVPLLSLGGSAARLSARRRDDRLATLRLLGATPGVVVRMTVLESSLVAVAGALVGVVLYVALMPLVGLVHFAGRAIGAGELWVGFGPLALVIVAIAALAAVSAAVGLRAVAISPLGVRTRQNAPKTGWIAPVAGVVIVIAAFAGLNLLGAITEEAGGIIMTIFVLAGCFGVAVAALNLIGPFAIRVMARIQLRTARTAEKLIAARGILESPKAAWRLCSGLAMTSFVAVVAGTGVSFVGDADGDPIYTDMRTGIVMTLVISFVMVACSIGVSQAAAVLDRRDLYVSLDRLGMPRPTVETARRRQVMLPVLLVSLGSAILGGILVFPLVGLALIIAPASLALIAASFVLGIALVWLALRSTRPVLTRVLREPERV